MKDKVKEYEPVMDQVRSNPKEQVLHGDSPKAVENAVLDSMVGHKEIAQQVLGDDKTARDFVSFLLKELVKEIGPQEKR